MEKIHQHLRIFSKISNNTKKQGVYLKIALIVTDKFTDYHLLETKLDELKVHEVISGTTKGYTMLERYCESRPHVKTTLAESGHRSAMRAYNAINLADDVVIFANGDGHRTEHAIANAINENKKLKIYSYKAKAFDVTREGEYARLRMSGNLKRASKIDAVYLNEEQIDKMIAKLNEIKNDLRSNSSN